MFIKEIRKQNKGFKKVFISHRLMESYRTEQGPRQRTILQLGKLELEQKHWKALADRIEALALGQGLLLAVEPEVEALAQHYANIIIENRLVFSRDGGRASQAPAQYETVNLKSLTHSQSRTLGAEHVGLCIFKQLGLDQFLRKLEFNKKQTTLSALSVVGKLVHPASELATREWAQSLSGIDELLGVDFRRLSQNALYRISDKLLMHKGAIERHLREKEKDIFSLEERVILYDLTNTYFEGTARHNKKARRGKSKDKQKGRSLVTLGLVIDEHGFAKKSEIFSGNASEPDTLVEMIDQLCEKKDKRGITVLLDAGIATEENLTLLKAQGYHYVCVARNRPVESSEINPDGLITIKEERHNKVEVEFVKTDGEHILYSKSLAKEQKEQAMKTLFQERFEAELKQARQALEKKGGTKRYPKVLERIGRLKERYSLVAPV